MIASLSGKISYLGDKYAIIDTGAIGYKVYINNKTIDILSNKKGKVNASAKLSSGILGTGSTGPSIDQKVTFYTHTVFNVRDNQMVIYGFLKPQELSFFELLLPISGLGPKKASSIISSVEPDKVADAVIKGDSDYLIKVGGLGTKTATRLITELKGKFESAIKTKFDLGSESEALEVLTALGYGKIQILEALKKIKGKASTEHKVKEALRILSNK